VDVRSADVNARESSMQQMLDSVKNERRQDAKRVTIIIRMLSYEMIISRQWQCTSRYVEFPSMGFVVLSSEEEGEFFRFPHFSWH
jgi:hypothetical protein